MQSLHRLIPKPIFRCSEKMQPFSTGGINPLTYTYRGMKRLLTMAALLFLAAPVQAARTVYQCTMASARGVETMSIDQKLPAQCIKANLLTYMVMIRNAVTQLHEFGGLTPGPINFYPDNGRHGDLPPASSEGDGPPLVSTASA